MYHAKLVPIPLTYQDDWRLPEWGFGITNIVSRSTPGSSTIKLMEYHDGRKQLLAKIRRYRPQIVALLGVTIYPVLFPDQSQASRQKKHPRQAVRPGLQSHELHGSKVFLLPNPSGRNAHYSYQEYGQTFSWAKNCHHIISSNLNDTWFTQSEKSQLTLRQRVIIPLYARQQHVIAEDLGSRV